MMRIDRVAGQHDAGGSRGVGGADHRAGVPGVADIGTDGDQRAAGEPGVGSDVQATADGDDPGGRGGVGERGECALFDQGPGHLVGGQRGELLGGGRGDEHLEYAPGCGQGALDRLGTVGQELAGLVPKCTTGELPRVLDPVVAAAQRHLVGAETRHVVTNKLEIRRP
ncbi:hypothetical protein GCM10009668_12300 [Nocardioides dubius]|uniref:Uncharacterized protein n=1 Tax=Nocardioides dubius TaxID=317019 RepID=A0ABN1TR48_9ACTN